MGLVLAWRAFLVVHAWACLAVLSQAAQDIDGNPVLVLSDDPPVDVPSTYYTELHPCPMECLGSPSNWTLYTSVDRLKVCEEPMLLDFTVQHPLDDPDTIVKLSVCTSGDHNSRTNALFAATQPGHISSAVRRANTARRVRRNDAPVCISGANETTAQLSTGHSGEQTKKSHELLEALDHLGAFFADESHCEASVLFSYSNGAVVGLYTGSAFGKTTVSSALEHLSSQIQSEGPWETMTAQLCGPGRNANHVFGIAMDTSGNLTAVQAAVASWARAECISEESHGSQSVSVWEAETRVNVVDNSTMQHNSTQRRRASVRQAPSLVARGECITHGVISGDSCSSLAAACGISGAAFTKYNPGENFCSKLMPGGRVCCSEGTLPDISPKQNPDGSCFSYQVQPNEGCDAIAAHYGITKLDIEKFNNGTNGTWGWTGCGNLLKYANICLSDGKPPMPAPVANAICGPLKPGTEAPTDGTQLADLNPCPLNACCNIWGQCGINGDFCQDKRGPSGNPGTSPPKVYGCISNCGTDIKNNFSAPSEFRRIGYYESWNFDRPCLNMKAEHTNTDGSYTHMHWAFALIDPVTFYPKINNTFKQWDDFKALPSNVKKIVSFGGWGYSTELATYDILRQAMNPNNRETFANNIVKFLADEKLDGVDFDWEYPGAPDIPGPPPGLPSDGADYVKFLAVLRGRMNTLKSMSIAAPASYWYLKQFPIKLMGGLVDYIVYMTYDLHGQWDTGNTFSVDGCPAGNCLRSHVNLTETMDALAMITKAGVPTNKIFVGESSYGRSFNMATLGCDGPDCTFLGDNKTSPAEPGMCTNTPGYISNAEINDIIATTKDVKVWHDLKSNSDLMVYDNFEWVAYMTPTTKSTRRAMWEQYHFAGTIDWAVDLQAFVNDDGLNPSNDTDTDWDWIWPNPPSTKGCGVTSAGTLEDLAKDDKVSFSCRPVFTLQLLKKNLTSSMSHFNDLLKSGYDGKFETYAKAVVDGAPSEVTKFMHDNGNKYFSCIISEAQICCDKCKTLGAGFPNPCLYCFKDGPCTSLKRDVLELDGLELETPEILGLESGSLADDMEFDGSLLDPRDRPPPGQTLSHTVVKYKNVSEPCPPDYSKRGISGTSPNSGATIYWTLNSDKKDQFFADLFTSVGIEEKDIAFKDQQHSLCSPGDSKEECRATNWDFGMPTPNGYDKSDVGNPKETVNNASTALKNLPSQIDDVLTALGNNSYSGSVNDIIDAISMPIFMIADALENMDSIVKTAEEIDKKKRQAIIFAFLSALFFLVPVAGEVIGTLTAFAGIARIAALIGELGALAMDIYDVVKDPKNAPLFIMGVLGAAAGLKDVAGVASAARARQTMPASDIDKLGTKMKARLHLVDGLKTSCIRKRDTVETELAWPMSPGGAF